MTADAMTGDEARCLAAGMDGYLSKPIQLDECCELIEPSSRGLERPRFSPDGVTGQDLKLVPLMSGLTPCLEPQDPSQE
jgi:CheY-like chemotaxis protein